MIKSIRDVAQLEDELSRPSPADVDFVRTLSGDVMVREPAARWDPRSRS